MGDHVVQIAGDSDSLLLGASLGLLLARSLRQLQPLAQQPDVGAVRPAAAGALSVGER
jgi:hypothetical protein